MSNLRELDKNCLVHLRTETQKGAYACPQLTFKPQRAEVAAKTTIDTRLK
jgi:hypothetical protein